MMKKNKQEPTFTMPEFDEKRAFIESYVLSRAQGIRDHASIGSALARDAVATWDEIERLLK